MYIVNTNQNLKSFENFEFFNKFYALLDNNLDVVRGKVIITLMFVIRIEMKHLIDLSIGKFFTY